MRPIIYSQRKFPTTGHMALTVIKCANRPTSIVSHLQRCGRHIVSAPSFCDQLLLRSSIRSWVTVYAQGYIPIAYYGYAMGMLLFASTGLIRCCEMRCYQLRNCCLQVWTYVSMQRWTETCTRTVYFNGGRSRDRAYSVLNSSCLVTGLSFAFCNMSFAEFGSIGKH